MKVLVDSFHLSNMSRSCQKSQIIAYSALRGAAPNTHIASFGNSDPRNLSEWVPVIGLDKSAPVVSQVHAVYNVDCVL